MSCATSMVIPNASARIFIRASATTGPKATARSSCAAIASITTNRRLPALAAGPLLARSKHARKALRLRSAAALCRTKYPNNSIIIYRRGTSIGHFYEEISKIYEIQGAGKNCQPVHAGLHVHQCVGQIRWPLSPLRSRSQGRHQMAASQRYRSVTFHAWGIVSGQPYSQKVIF